MTDWENTTREELVVEALRDLSKLVGEVRITSSNLEIIQAMGRTPGKHLQRFAYLTTNKEYETLNRISRGMVLAALENFSKDIKNEYKLVKVTPPLKYPGEWKLTMEFTPREENEQ